MSEPTTREVTSLWKDCYYPWLSNGWIECACGKWFHSEQGSFVRANALHHEHVKAGCPARTGGSTPNPVEATAQNAPSETRNNDG